MVVEPPAAKANPRGKQLEKRMFCYYCKGAGHTRWTPAINGMFGLVRESSCCCKLLLLLLPPSMVHREPSTVHREPSIVDCWHGFGGAARAPDCAPPGVAWASAHRVAASLGGPSTRGHNAVRKQVHQAALRCDPSAETEAPRAEL